MLAIVTNAIGNLFSTNRHNNNRTTTNYLTNNQTSQNATNNREVTTRKVANVFDNIPTINHKLYQAICFENIAAAKSLIKQGASLKDYLNAEYNYHPLRIAIDDADIELLKFFLQEGFDPNTKIAGGYSPLSHALFSVNRRYIVKKMVNILIEHGANVNTDAGTEYSPLATAIERGYYDIFQLLLDKEAQINTVIENQPMSKEMVLALHHRNILLMIELICRGATITKHACKYSKLSNVDDYSDEYKIKIYDLLKKYKIETANDINSLELVADTKEILKDKLFPVEPVIRSTKIINLKFF